MISNKNISILSTKAAVNAINKDRLWNVNFSLGLEIWQIFIVLTIILTSASGLMWFTNLQPETLKQEYLLIDKTKSEIFNRAEKIKYEMANVVFPETTKSSSKTCYEDVLTESFVAQDYLDKIIAEEKALNEINSQFVNNVNILSTSGAGEIIKYSLDYSVESKLDIEKTALYYQQVQKINQESIQLCKATIDKVPNLASNLDSLSKNEIVGSVNAGLVKNTLSMLQTSTSIAESALKTGNVQSSDKELFLKHFTEVITSKPDNTKFLASSKKKYEDLMLKIDNLESWQKNFISDKNTNSYKTVWVLPKNKNIVS
jgi:hypothetical protein